MLRSRLKKVFIFTACSLTLPASAFAQQESVTLEELEAELAKRDAVIISLQHALADLENRLITLESGQQQQPASKLADGSTVGEVMAAEATALESRPRSERGGSLIVDELAAERALERTLVQTGALLLPKGTVEVVPTLSYTRDQFEFPSVADFGGGPEIGSVRIDRAELGAGVVARFGLPFDSQIEIGLPYRKISEESAFLSGGLPVETASASGKGTGDLVIAVSKALAREEGITPDIIGQFRWNSGQGDVRQNGVFLGGGFESWAGSLTFLKRRDPLALFLSLDYEKFRSNEGIAPGDAFTMSLGSGFAVSPESSLFSAITFRSISNSRIDDMDLSSGDREIFSLSLGYSTILRQGFLLNLFSEIGISDNAPDFSLQFSLPIRFRSEMF